MSYEVVDAETALHCESGKAQVEIVDVEPLSAKQAPFYNKLNQCVELRCCPKF